MNTIVHITIMIASGSLFVMRGITFYRCFNSHSWAKIKLIFMRIIVYMYNNARIHSWFIQINNNHFQMDISRYYIDIHSQSSFYTRDHLIPKMQLALALI